jgi:hypothetical protein
MPDAAGRADPKHLTAAELAAHLSTPEYTVSQQTVQNWIRRGCPRNEDGTFVFQDVARYLARANARQGRPMLPETDEERVLKNKKHREWLRSSRQRRLIEADKFCSDRCKLRTEMGRMTAEIRAVLLNLPARAARSLAGKPEAEVAALLEAEIGTVFDTLSGASESKEDDQQV